MAPARLELTGRDGAAIQVEEQVTVEDRSRYDFARRVALMLSKGKKLAAQKAIEQKPSE